MRVLIVAPGTRGDVAPLAGLAAALHARHGFDVAIAANAGHRPTVTASGSEFRELPGDMGGLATPAPPGQKATAADLRRYMAELRAYMDLAATGTLAAAQAGADMILANAIAPYAYDVAEAMGIPALGVHLQPLEPSRVHAPVLLGTAKSFTPPGNKLLGTLVAAGRAPYDAPAARLRRELGLPSRSRRQSEARRRKNGQVVLHGFSSAVVPRPGDWAPRLKVAGYWWPATDKGWTPNPALEDFLAAGPPPVFIGFGSTGALDAEFMLDVVARAGVRAVLQGVDCGSRPDAISVGDVPHEWLFPRMSAVVHHGGAGTTAAGLRAGRPTVTVPVFTDQPFWGKRVHELGAGPAPVPYKNATAEGLAGAIAEAVKSPGYLQAAAKVASVIGLEDGTQAVAAEILAARSPA